MEYAGLIYDDSRHYLDHLGPFCALAKWPLILCEPHLADLAAQGYPDLEILSTPLWELKLPKTVVSCDTLPLLRSAFPGQSIDNLWLPHGNSDKGWSSPFFEAMQEEKTALVYGQRMIDFMKKKKVFPKTIRVGNFRREYFFKHKDFYHEMIRVPKSGKNFLYAPTWDDSENNCSFWNAFPKLASRIPSDCNLLIKLHPNTIRKFAPEIETLMGRFAKQKNIYFLPDDPPVYPLLAGCAAYIGDMSSIGYDFLAFDRPLFFLNANQALPLHRCGAPIDLANFDFSLNDSFSSIRKTTYDYTFDPDWNPHNWSLT